MEAAKIGELRHGTITSRHEVAGGSVGHAAIWVSRALELAPSAPIYVVSLEETHPWQNRLVHDLAAEWRLPQACGAGRAGNSALQLQRAAAEFRETRAHDEPIKPRDAVTGAGEALWGLEAHREQCAVGPVPSRPGTCATP